jgi:threonylcarbamoyladenosine tRNA methylthiotransferase MtaB
MKDLTYGKGLVAAVINLGCKANKCECDALARGLAARGFIVSEKLAVAHVYILNTCAVTAEAERKSRQAVARCLAKNLNARVLIVGCAAQRNPEVFARMAGVAYVAGTTGKADVLDFLDGEFGGYKKSLGATIAVKPIDDVYEDLPSPMTSRIRAYVKIQDGCDNFCAYCIVPHVRGRSRSRSVEAIVRECRTLAKTAHEIVLTGINIADFGKNIGSSLVELLRALVDIPVRIRLSSLDASVIDDRLLDALVDLRMFCPHFHLSLQSGDDAVLATMNRRYTAERFFNHLQKIRAVFPTAAITTDLICGFPTETERNFEISLNFARRAGFANMHVFPYSRRIGTAAEKYFTENGGGVAPPEIARRVKLATELRDKMKVEFEARFIGRPLDVLIEHKRDGELSGYSENYIRVYAAAATIGEVATLIPTRRHKNGLAV